MTNKQLYTLIGIPVVLTILACGALQLPAIVGNNELQGVMGTVSYALICIAAAIPLILYAYEGKANEVKQTVAWGANIFAAYLMSGAALFLVIASGEEAVVEFAMGLGVQCIMLLLPVALGSFVIITVWKYNHKKRKKGKKK